MPLSEIVWTPDEAMLGGPGSTSGDTLALTISPAGAGVLEIALGTIPQSSNYTLAAGAGGGLAGPFLLLNTLPPPSPFRTSTISGYWSAQSIGSLSPSTFNGEAITIMAQQSLDVPNASYDGFYLSDPSGLITSITINGTTLLTASAQTDSAGLHFWTGIFPVASGTVTLA